MFFNPFSPKESFADDENNLNVISYHDVFRLHRKYLMAHNFKTKFKNFSKNSLSTLHSNIRSINKNSESFSEFYSKVNDINSAICCSETWTSEEDINKNSTFALKICNVPHQVRISWKGEELCTFIHDSLCYKLRKDLSINSEAIESLSIEISNKKAHLQTSSWRHEII